MHRFRRGRGGRFRIVLLLVLLAAGAAYFGQREAEVRSGRATVVDGDSLRLDGASVRLHGIDAPELGQTCTVAGKDEPCGQAAARELARLVAQGEVRCRVVGRDRYGRDLGRCAVGATDLGATLVSSGHAVAYGRDTPYAREEAEARRQGRGIWAGPFQRPEDWRKDQARARERVDPSAKP
ncbi:MAG TPA: thermonuclease family protein [Beijerinckiaceae bacterium]|nr:thermonuclease family protein [Beijerinckiaceae bacterium]